MFDSSSNENGGFEAGWQPDGWDLPAEDTPVTSDAYAYGVDPDLLPPTDAEYSGEDESLVAEMSLPLQPEGEPAADPETVRTAVRTQCLADIKECLADARTSPPAGFFNFTRESGVVQDMIREAVLDDDAGAVAAHIATIEALPTIAYSAKIEANFAGAVLGDPAAAALVHKALETEQANALLYMENERVEKPDIVELRRPHYAPLLNALIKRCVDYNVPADHWIDTYAVSAEDQWARTAGYLRSRIEAAASGTDTSALQQAYDQHMSTLAALPPAFTVDRIAEDLEYIVDPAVRDRLVDHVIVAVGDDDVPLSLKFFSDIMRVGSIAVDDPKLSTPGRYDFFSRAYKMGGRALVEDHSYLAVIYAVYPYTEAVMHSRGFEPDVVIAHIDKMTENISRSQRREANWHQTPPMEMRDAWLASSAQRFAQAGNFEGAQQLLSSMSPEYAQRVARARCLDMVTTADELSALQLDELTLAAEPEFVVQYEVASLRVAGDTEELITRAASHARAIRPFTASDPESPPADGLSSTAHSEYVETARRAIVRMDAAQLPVFAKQVLPILRSLSRTFNSSSTMPLSEALITSGDTKEPEAALAYINEFKGPRDMKLESLWQLAKMLRRANESR
jgi:hypothetical protein